MLLLLGEIHGKVNQTQGRISVIRATGYQFAQVKMVRGGDADDQPLQIEKICTALGFFGQGIMLDGVSWDFKLNN